ncbi:kinase-like domain-containing protein [Choanephora cucurbitarum]|nr:kinase-like domain-containing protein [Choanephora cucurbitarum]
MKFSCKLSRSTSTPDLKGSQKICERARENADRLKKRQSIGIAYSPLVGFSPEAKRRLAQPAKSSTMIKRRNDGYCDLIETKNAWGYLVQGNGHVFVFDRQLNNRKHNEPAGYVIGSGKDCDIIIHHKAAEERHAFIFYETRFQDNKYSMPVYICNQSANGIWINGKKMVNQIQNIKTNDHIFFLDPNTYLTKENICYVFVEPKQPLSTVKSIDTLYQSTHESLGEGNYGKVYLAKCKETGNRVAVKVVPRRSFKDLPQWQIALLREVSVCMLFPDHPCIVKISRMFVKNEDMYIIMEYGPHGDLFEMIVDGDYDYKEHEVRILFDQIAHAVACLHENNIVHRDIKLENVIVTDKANLRVKLCDFGFSTIARPGRDLLTGCGTSFYAAPEIKRKKPYSKSVDIWSLGMLLYVALTSSHPYALPGKEDDYVPEHTGNSAKYRTDHPRWKGLSKDAKDLVNKMLQVDPKKRVDIQQVLDHPWLQNINNLESIKAGVKRNPLLVDYLESKKN